MSSRDADCLSLFYFRLRLSPAFLLSTSGAEFYNRRPVSPRSRQNHPHGFTLIELMVVIGIIVVLMVLLVPAFKGMKSAGDVTSAAYTVKGVLDQARTYAMTNNTYAWVGFFEEDINSTTPAVAGNGRLVLSVVASKDGTSLRHGDQRHHRHNQADPDRQAY